jgi:hypothetical protein
MTQREAEKYFPPPGITVNWYNWDPIGGTVLAEFIASGKEQFFYEQVKTLNDIEDELAHNPYLKRRVCMGFREIDELQIRNRTSSTRNLGRKDILLADELMDFMPRGVRHRLVENHNVSVSPRELESIDSQIRRAGSSKNHAYPFSDVKGSDYKQFPVAHLKEID